MGRSTGRADLPLHGGRVPAWLATRMAELGRVVVEAIILRWDRDEVLRRLAHPFWFQSLGAVIGMDWHSSGITTSVVGALKRGLAPVAEELGLYVCGGRGRHSRRTPEELTALSDRLGLDGAQLTRTSRLVAKVDNAALQDGFQIYLHSFIVAADSRWTVVQQGMDPDAGQARRYHWLSDTVSSFIDDPHAAVDGEPRGDIVNLADRRAEPNRRGQLELLGRGPDVILDTLRRAPHLVMPAHHEVRPENVVSRRLAGSLRAAADASPADFETLLLTAGVGPRTLASLAMVSEVIHGGPSRFTDPARFSMAHGGKDGHPFPVPLKVYDETIRVLKGAVEAAKLGSDTKLAAVRRLDAQARLLERASDVDLSVFMRAERRASHRLGGMTVFGPAKPLRRPAPERREAHRARQLSLPGIG